MVVSRIKMDETDEGRGPFNWTLPYNVYHLFNAFARLAAGTAQLAGADRLLIVKWL